MTMGHTETSRDALSRRVMIAISELLRTRVPGKDHPEIQADIERVLEDLRAIRQRLEALDA